MESYITVTCLICIVSVKIPAGNDRVAFDELLDDYGWQPVKAGGAYCPDHRHR